MGGRSSAEGSSVADSVAGGTGAVSFDSQPISGDPRFVSAGSDFHLQAGSPALDSGSSTVLPVVVSCTLKLVVVPDRVKVIS